MHDTTGTHRSRISAAELQLLHHRAVRGSIRNTALLGLYGDPKIMSLASAMIGKGIKASVGGTSFNGTITDTVEITSATNANKAVDGLKKNIKASGSYLVLVIKQ